MTVQGIHSEISASQPLAGEKSILRGPYARAENQSYGSWSKAATLSYDMDNPPPLTKGEKIFNAGTWWGLGWGANVGLSLYAADKMEAGSLQWLYNGLTDSMAKTKMFNWLDSTNPKNTYAVGKKIPKGMPRKWTRSISSLLILMGGGFAVMVPMKWAEDRKKGIVERLDGMFGKRESQMTEDEIAIRDARYEYLDHEPHQSWGTMLGGRIYTLIPVLAVHYSLAQPQNVVNALLGEAKFKGLAYHWGKAGEALQVLYRKASGEFGEGGAPLEHIADVSRSFTKREKALDGAPEKLVEKYAKDIKAGVFEGKVYPHTKATEVWNKGVTTIWKKDTPIAERIANDSKEGLILEPKTGAQRLHGILSNGMVDTFYSGMVATGTFLMAKSFANDREGVGRQAKKERMDIAKRMGVPYEDVPTRPRSAHAAHVEVDGQPPSELNEAQESREIREQRDVPSMTVGQVEEYIASQHAQGMAREVGAS